MLLLLPTLLLVASCDDTSAPVGTLTGAYVLARMNGSPPPALIARTATGVEGHVTSGSADFYARNRVRITLTIDWSGPGVTQPTTSHQLDESYHTNGPKLEFDGSSTTGHFDAASVTITHDLLQTRVAGYYVKQ